MTLWSNKSQTLSCSMQLCRENLCFLAAVFFTQNVCMYVSLFIMRFLICFSKRNNQLNNMNAISAENLCTLSKIKRGCSYDKIQYPNQQISGSGESLIYQPSWDWTLPYSFDDMSFGLFMF